MKLSDARRRALIQGGGGFVTRPGWECDIEGGVIVFDVAELDVAKANRKPRGVEWEDAIADDWVACNARGEPTGEVAIPAELLLSELQRQQVPWVEYNFGDRASYWPLLGAVEELGELAHAHLKSEQGIRGSADEHEAKAKDAVADTIIFLCDYATARGWDIGVIVTETWARVRQRDFNADPDNGGEVRPAPSIAEPGTTRESIRRDLEAVTAYDAQGKPTGEVATGATPDPMQPTTTDLLYAASVFRNREALIAKSHGEGVQAWLDGLAGLLEALAGPRRTEGDWAQPTADEWEQACREVSTGQGLDQQDAARWIMGRARELAARRSAGGGE